MNTIEHDCHMQSGPIIRKILQEWLKGKGLPVTWETLVQTLRDIDLSVLADHIHHLHVGHVTDSGPPQKKQRLQ